MSKITIEKAYNIQSQLIEDYKIRVSKLEQVVAYQEKIIKIQDDWIKKAERLLEMAGVMMGYKKIH